MPLGLPLVIEPGRFLVAEAGGLLTRVIYVKEAEQAISDRRCGHERSDPPQPDDAYHPIFTAKEGKDQGKTRRCRRPCVRDRRCPGPGASFTETRGR